VTATLECLCSVSFGTLVSAWGQEKGNANVPLEQHLPWSKKKKTQKGMRRMSALMAGAKVAA
jgi:hypothetical protein